MLKNILHQSYILGYGQWLAPRWLRKVLAGTELHRSWLIGYMGIYEEQGKRYGVCDRQWLANRFAE
ncbi:hypothetical protein [Alteromonas macleodii]|jgi:hypothetical protein|uniref:hypothetical protein n=1 Tax=Alteromonas macleodii TaxID=28108 RepID=UPI0031403D9F